MTFVAGVTMRTPCAEMLKANQPVVLMVQETGPSPSSPPRITSKSVMLPIANGENKPQKSHFALEVPKSLTTLDAKLAVQSAAISTTVDKMGMNLRKGDGR